MEFSELDDYRKVPAHAEAHGFHPSQLWKRYVFPEEVLRKGRRV
jgi:hypothetical protein